MRKIGLCTLLGASLSVHAGLDPAKRAIVGYLHNGAGWAGTPAVCVRDVPQEYNVINMSFIEQVPGDPSAVQFSPDPSYVSACSKYGSLAEEIAFVKAQGRRVQISIGGQNGHIELKTPVDRDRFVETTIGILKEYGFDGLDIDLEGASIGNVPDGGQFENSGNPKIELFKQGIDQILTLMGPDFWLTAAPEIFYVQAAQSAYGNNGVTGAYLPFLYHFKDRINILHVQLYNASNETVWIDGKGTMSLPQTSPDFTVWHTEALLKGFKTNNGAGPAFPPLAPQRVAIGRPCKAAAASSGQPTIEEQVQALHWMLKGAAAKPSGAKLDLTPANGYPDLRGVMTWSVNHDAVQNYAWAKAMYAELSQAGDPAAIQVPVKSQLQVAWQLNGSELQLGERVDRVQLYSLKGQKVLEAKSVDRLSLQGLHPGAYFLRVHQGGKSMAQMLNFTPAS